MAVVQSSDDFQKPPWLARVTSTQWRRLDVAIAVVLGIVAIVSLIYPSNVNHSSRFATSEAGWILYPLYAIAAFPIAVRRRWPLEALALTTAAVVIVTILGQPLPPVPFVALPLYSATTTATRRRSVMALIAVEIAIGASILVSVIDGRGDGNFSSNLLLLVATWFIADSIRTRRVYLRGLAQQTLERQRLALEGEHRAIIQERLEIARELHDVLAHSLSVITIQSSVGRHVMNEQPQEARKALLAVENTSRSALGELRRVLGVLRRGDDGEGDLLPAPSLDDLDTLLDGVRSAGVRVDYVLDGEIPQLSEGLQLSVYRIIQEALTNVVKHAHEAPATVRLSFPPEEVVVEIINDAIANTTPAIRDDDHVAHEGHGILGMTERALAFDGSLSAQPLPGGGFRVLARLSSRGSA